MEKKTDQSDLIDFKIFSAPISVTKGLGDDRPYVKGIATSECKDLAGDIMTRDALNDFVQKMGINSAVCFNHKYEAPEDIFGGVAIQPNLKVFKPGGPGLLKPVKEFAAAELLVYVNRANPRAKQAFDTINDEGILLGFSVGFNILDFEMITDEKSGAPTGFKIIHIEPLEESLVTIPCNQQSYVLATSGTWVDSKSVDLDLITKGMVSYVPPVHQTTDTNWAKAAAKGLFKRYGANMKFNTDADFVYACKNFTDFDDVTAAWLYQQNQVYHRWGLTLAHLPQEN